jgi:hypothetical protein
MTRKRGFACAFLVALAVALGIPSAGRADVIGMCQGAKMTAKSLKALNAKCHAKSGGRGVVSRVRRPR